MIRPILKYGDDILIEPARRVEAITPDVEQLIDDMIVRRIRKLTRAGKW